MKILYQTSVTTTGGREGTAESSDGRLSVKLSIPKELGGTGAPGTTNPEQLFAAGYSACFESALRHAARLKKIVVKEAHVTATVALVPADGGAFALAVDLKASLPGMEREQAEMLVQDAHRVCPYSNATRGNIEVNLELA